MNKRIFRNTEWGILICSIIKNTCKLLYTYSEFNYDYHYYKLLINQNTGEKISIKGK